MAAGAGCLEVSLYSCNPTSFDFGFFIPKSMAGVVPDISEKYVLVLESLYI